MFARKINQLKTLNERKRVVASGQDSTQLNFYLVKGIKEQLKFMHGSRLSVIPALKRQACRPLSLRSTWSAEQVPEQLSFGNKGNHQKQKAGKDVIEQGSHSPASESSRT